MASSAAQIAPFRVRSRELSSPAPASSEAALPSGEVCLTADFETLVKQNHARILRLALGMVRDRDLADDVAQETFIRAFRFYRSFRSESAFFTWLYRIAVNLCIDVQRKRGRMAAGLDELAPEAEPVDPSPTPDRIFEVSELAKHTEAAL